MWRVLEGTDGHREVSGGEIVPQRGVKETAPQGRAGAGEGRENTVPMPIGEAPDSMRGLTRVQYPSRVNEKGY